MKTLNKLGLLGVFATACALPLSTRAASLPAVEDGKITLKEDVTISDKAIFNAKGSTLTIDLNGHKLIRDGYRGYLIDNRGVLTITDSSEKKGGTVECKVEPNNPANPSSCVRNYDTLNVENVTVKSNWTVLKNEEGSTMNVKNSVIDSSTGERSNTAGTVMNYGALTMENSKVYGSTTKDGAAIFALTYVEGDKVYSSSAIIKNSEISAYWPVIVQQDDKTRPLSEGETATVTFEDGTIVTSSEEGSKIARIQDILARSNNETFKLSLKGDITASTEALEYLEENSKLTLNKDVTEETVVKAGYTVVVPDRVTVENGMLKLEPDAKLENKSGQDVTFIFLADEEKEITLKDNGLFEGTVVEEPSEPTDPEKPTEPEDPKNPEKPTEPEDPKNPEEPKEPEKNPQTFDGVMVYAVLLAISAGGLGLVLKKHLN